MVEAKKANSKFVLSDGAYGICKNLVQVLLPTLSSAYFGLSSLWDFPATEKVLGTLAVFATFLGVLLRINSRNYAASDAEFDGNLVVLPREAGGLTYSFEVNGDPEDFLKKNKLSFKVDRQS